MLAGEKRRKGILLTVGKIEPTEIPAACLSATGG
jgi:hypothetical protein